MKRLQTIGEGLSKKSVKEASDKTMGHKIEIGKNGKQFYCGIGDGTHDGLYGYGESKEAAALDFINKLSKDKQFIVIDQSQLK